MECISSTYTPVIVQPDLSGPDWTQQHMLGETIRLGQAKQTKQTRQPLSLESNAFRIKSWTSRRSSSLHTLLQIPGTQSRVRVGKPAATLKTPIKINNTRPSKEWEELLKSSMATLQGAYKRLEAPAVPTSQTLGARWPQSHLTAGLDRTEIASRALQVAAGCAMFSADYDDEASSSGSEDSYGSGAAPETPHAMQTNEDVHIDPRLFS